LFFSLTSDNHDVIIGCSDTHILCTMCLYRRLKSYHVEMARCFQQRLSPKLFRQRG